MISKYNYLTLIFSIVFFTVFIEKIEAQDKPLDSIAAVVNNDIIMVSEVRSAVSKVKIPNKAELSQSALFRQVLDTLILDKIQVQRAKQIGIKIDDAALDKAMLSIAAQNKLDLQQFRVALIKEGLNYEDFRESIRDQLYKDTLQKRQQGRNNNITESEVDDLVQAESMSLSRGVQYKIIDILVPNKHNNSVQQFNANLSRANSLRKRLLGKTKISSDLLKANGASIKDWGLVDASKLSPVYIRALSLMNEGELSNVIRDSKGFHILKLIKQSGGSTQKSQQVKARHILISNETPNARLKAIQIRNQILAGEDFAKLAQQFSNDKGSGEKGGDLGTTSPTSFVPPFARAVSTLPINTISRPIQTRFGWHIIEVLERQFGKSSRNDIKQQAQTLISEQKKNLELNNWLQSLRDQAFVEYRVQF